MECYCARTRRAARVLTARYDAALSGAGMTSSQFELMKTLQSCRVSSGAGLARLLVVDKTTLSRNLGPLILHGWIQKRPSQEDGRIALYALTPAGEAALHQALPLWKSVHASIKNKLKQVDVLYALEQLEKVAT